MNTAECVLAGEAGAKLEAASMEPPCEHGGVAAAKKELAALLALQWSRRVNTAEWGDAATGDKIGHGWAAMEPPCEHGGVLIRGSCAASSSKLQWSRRVNTAE